MPPSGSMTFRALSWNIHKGIGGVDRRYRPERMLEVLLHYEPDLVMLQEVDEGARRSRFHRQVDLIGEALQMEYRCYAPNVRLRSKGHYGNATLARWPCIDAHNIDLTIRPKKRRSALYARFRIRQEKRTRTIAVFNLHLGLAGFERRLQIKRFLNSHPFAHFHTRTPVIVGGDLNDFWGSLGRRYLEPAGFRRAGRLMNTYPAVFPVRPLDGLFVHGDLSVRRCFRSRMGVARAASDHLPLIADLELGWTPPLGSTRTPRE